MGHRGIASSLAMPLLDLVTGGGGGVLPAWVVYFYECVDSRGTGQSMPVHACRHVLGDTRYSLLVQWPYER